MTTQSYRLEQTIVSYGHALQRKDRLLLALDASGINWETLDVCR